LNQHGGLPPICWKNSSELKPDVLELHWNVVGAVEESPVLHAGSEQSPCSAFSRHRLWGQLHAFVIWLVRNGVEEIARH